MRTSHFSTLAKRSAAAFALSISLISVSANAAELLWEKTYGAAVARATAEQKELFIFFRTPKTTSEETLFLEALKDKTVIAQLENRVLLEISTEEIVGDKVLSKDAWFQNNFASTGGFVLIDLKTTANGKLKNTYAFHPASSPNSFRSWEPKELEGVLSGRIRQDMPGTTVQPQVVATAPSTTTPAAPAVAGGSDALAALNAARARSGLRALMHDETMYQTALGKAQAAAQRGMRKGHIGGSFGGGSYEGTSWSSSNSPGTAGIACYAMSSGLTYAGSACVYTGAGTFCCNIYR